ncbi:uncharacterized protein TRIADDRAFT_20006, partial [Trichoplax adhaerens]
GVTYLDNIGSALYCESQLENYLQELKGQLFANPHSRNASSKQTLQMIDQMRDRILDHFNTNSDDYRVIFTSGATDALKIIHDSFQWHAPYDNSDSMVNGNRLEGDHAENIQPCFCYLEDNHTSVIGIRQAVSRHVGMITCVDIEAVETADSTGIHNIEIDNGDTTNCTINHLFAYPAQSNFSGRKYPLQWIDRIQRTQLVPNCVKIREKDRWYVLLDAASYISTSPLDLGRYKPDFVPISFYKLFGFPTGLGALIVRNNAINVLRKQYFGGGTIQTCLYHDDFVSFKTVPHDRYEDGTVAFLDIIALKYGFDCLCGIARDMDAVCNHTFSITRYTYQNMLKLCHYNCEPLCHIYGESDYSNSTHQGPVINFNLLDSKGNFIGYSQVSKLAEMYKIELRTGCFCNLGQCQKSLGLSSAGLLHNFQSGHICGDDIDLIDGKPTGSIRISIGYLSSFEDSDRFIKFLEECFVEFLVESESKEDNIEIDSKEIHFNVLKPSIPKLQRIVLYPVKSCNGFEVDSWPIGPRGLLYDRSWMIVNESGVCLNLKQEPKMYNIRPKINLEDKLLILDCEGVQSLLLPLSYDMPDQFAISASVCQSRVCGDKVNGIDCGDEASLWLSKVLQRTVRLIMQHDNSKRSTKSRTSNDERQPILSLANTAQILLISSTSATILYKTILKMNAFEKSPVSTIATVDSLCDRFRANLIIQGGQPFAEDCWKYIKIGHCRFTITGPCTRCHIICIDPATKTINKDPLKALMKLRGKKVFIM